MGDKSSPFTGRWQPQADGGGGPRAVRSRPTPSTTAFGGGPPPRPGEEFAAQATQLAGLAGLLFGWTPDTFWTATPAELGALVAAAAGDRPAPVDLCALMEMFPDG